MVDEFEVDFVDNEMPEVPTTDVEVAIAMSPVIGWLKSKDFDLQNQINDIKTNHIGKVHEKISDVKDLISDITDKNDEQDFLLDEIKTNVNNLKQQTSRNTKAIEYLRTNVIRDETYLNFKTRCAAVYAKNGSELNRGDIYINSNKNIAAINSTYINVRDESSEEPFTENDWQELFTSSVQFLNLPSANNITINWENFESWLKNFIKDFTS